MKLEYTYLFVGLLTGAILGMIIGASIMASGKVDQECTVIQRPVIEVEMDCTPVICNYNCEPCQVCETDLEKCIEYVKSVKSFEKELEELG